MAIRDPCHTAVAAVPGVRRGDPATASALPEAAPASAGRFLLLCQCRAERASPASYPPAQGLVFQSVNSHAGVSRLVGTVILC